MKLFLTSTVFVNKSVTKKVFKKIKKPIEICKILFVPNQKATLESLNGDKYINRIEKWGFKKDNIYIFNKFEPKKSKNLDIDIIAIGGGNTFETLDIMRKTNFDREIINYVKDGVVFIGGSAGAHIVTKNIEHVQFFDDNDINMKDFEALGILDGILICHYDDDRVKIANQIINTSQYRVYLLTNKDVLYVNDDRIIKY